MAAVVLSQLAEDDLVEIWCTVAVDNVRAADRLVDEIYATAQLLALQPSMGRLRPDFGPDVRSFPRRDYILFYRFTGHTVGIARVVHGARDLERLHVT
jgi:toxin ParE1/3/4